jgi:hypothetical protein
MRQDPPFDFEYVAATWLLERAESRGRAHLEQAARDPRPFRKGRHHRVPAVHADHADRPRSGRHPCLHRRTRRRHPQAARRHGRQQHLPRLKDDPNRNVIVETLTNFGARSIMAQRYLPAISPRRQAHPADRRRARALLPGAHSQGRRIARQPRRRRQGRGAPADGPRPRNRRGAGADFLGARPADRRPRRDRRQPDRDQRHQPHLFRRDRPADALRRRRDAGRCPGTGMRRAGS